MAKASACPGVEDLERFLAGALPADSCEQLAAHLGGCAHCQEIAHTLKPSDTILDALRGQKPPASLHERETVEWLIRELKSLGTGRHDPVETVAASSAPDESTPPGGSAPLTQVTEELYDFLAPPEQPGELGRLGGYRVLRVLGTGGMGVVFLAEDPGLERRVALKAMLPSLGANPASKKRFLREAKAAAAIKHDHIVTIHQVGEDRGVPFLAMEFLEGEPLDKRLERDGKLPLADVLRIGREIAEALAAAHDRGLIHRDIKPGNIWLEAGRVVSGRVVSGEDRGRPTPATTHHSPLHHSPSRVKLLDFGLARPVADDAGLTHEGAIVGTPAYMAPEQAVGEQVDQRCDLFSLGCVLYRMATGGMPFRGANTLAVLASLATETPKRPQDVNPALPPALSNLIMQLLAKKPDKRPDSARAVAEALRVLEESAARGASPAAARPRRRLPIVAAAAGLLVTLVVAAVITIRLGGPDDGTVTIETVDDNIELTFKNGDQEFTIRDKKTGAEVKLPVGKYQVALRGGKQGLKLETQQITLTRDGKEVVRVTWQAGKKPPTAISDRVQVPEPPPLAEWLKGRKILTVSQEGKGQFKTIQAALEALKPHQVVKVLDRGPYRERLHADTMPPDTGLISEQQTVIELIAEDAGHVFAPVLDGFRLSGLCFVGAVRKPMVFLGQPSGLVVEDCCFRQAKSAGGHGAMQFLYHRQDPNVKPLFIRNCVFDYMGFVLPAGGPEIAPVVVIENNYFKRRGIYCELKHVRHLVIRHNVFDFVDRSTTPLITLFESRQVDGAVEVHNNTTLADGITLIGSVPAPPQSVIIRNNLTVRNLHVNPAKLADLKMQVDHNGYLRLANFPRATTDVAEDPSFLSKDPAHSDYLRLPADNPLARGGAGGAWPSYIGALAPGPAPKEGDWFTRLRQRWGNLPPTGAPLSPPVRIPEPPPLADWLKGRKILTVSQDGKGEFKTIQAALDALKPGQVVKVLDRGPYRENLERSVVPEDCGLISEQQTVVTYTEWTKKFGNGRHGHLFGNMEGLRIHGFRFTIPARPDGDYNYGMLFVNPASLVLENCCIQVMGKGAKAFSVNWLNETARPIWLRDCLVEGRFTLSTADKGRGTAVLERNFLDGPGSHCIYVHGSFSRLVVRHNVLGENVKHSDIVFDGLKDIEALEISNNTALSAHPFVFSTSVPRENVVIRNNLRTQPGLAVVVTEGGAKLVRDQWQVSHNAYPRELPHGELNYVKEMSFPPAPQDVLVKAQFLSTDRLAVNYLRTPSDSPMASGGTGGAWPSYIGALPPGPAPKEGDWFTRLRQHWVQPASSAPVQIPEPPPLAEWLKGRKILTVSQDGKGQFKTIKAALEALKPHQAVKVLDPGPYLESLKVGALPPDTGLISEQQTVLKIPSLPAGMHAFGPLAGFRLSGFRLLAPRPQGEYDGLSHWNDPSGLVVENCYFGWTEPKNGASINLIFNNHDPNAQPVVVRNCLFDSGGLYVADLTGSGPCVAVFRNYFKNATIASGGPGFPKMVIRYNVLAFPKVPIWFENALPKEKPAAELLEITNNTHVGNGEMLGFARAAPTRGFIARNNIFSIGLHFEAVQKVADNGVSNKDWQLDHNCYIRRASFSKAPSDVLDEPPFLFR